MAIENSLWSVRDVSTGKKRKKGISTRMIALVAVFFIGIATVVAIWQLLSQQVYYGVWYSTPVIRNGKVGIPLDFVSQNKIVYIDVKLSNKTSAEDMLNWATTRRLRETRREIATLLYVLGNYPKGRLYLPLLCYQTPSGKIVGALRTCEPCESFEFRIGGKNLICQRCGTEWKLEDLREIAYDRGCGVYPPPELPITVEDETIWIDISPLTPEG